LGIANPSAEYLAGYVGKNQDIPAISPECVMKATGLIQQMGRERLKPRKNAMPKSQEGRRFIRTKLSDTQEED